MSALDELRAALDEQAGELEGVGRMEAAGGVEYRVGTTVAAAVGSGAGASPAGAEFRIGKAIGAAALRTPDVSASPRGPEWVRFAPPTLDRFALDRAIAWFELAVRQAGSTTAG